MVADLGQQFAILLGSIVAGLLALARMSLGQHRGLVDQFVTFVETQLQRHAEADQAIADALRELSEGTRENTATLRRMGEQLGVRFNKQDEPWR